MKCLVRILALLSFVSFSDVFAKPGRTIEVEETDVAEIHTGLGFSTLLQFDQRPTSAVLGDQDSFRVEYVGNGLTVKPLVPNATTNLFVFTDYDRFSFKLVVTKGSGVDYHVRVKRRLKLNSRGIVERSFPPEAASSPLLQTEKVESKKQRGELSVSVESVSLPPSRAAILVNFSVRISAKDLSRGDPRLLRPRVALFQQGKPIPIHDLYLSAQTLVRGELRSEGILVFRAGALNGRSRVELQLTHPINGDATVSVPVPLEKLYRKEAKRETSGKGR